MIVLRVVSHGPGVKLPLFSMTISAGPPSTAEDYVEEHLDIAQFLIPHPDRSFLVRVDGDSMIDVGINDGDLLVVERALQPKNGDIVVAQIADQFTVKIFQSAPLSLVPANKNHSEVTTKEFSVWGVARYAIHKL